VADDVVQDDAMRSGLVGLVVPQFPPAREEGLVSEGESLNRVKGL
jgi:hypothetical protein